MSGSLRYDYGGAAGSKTCDICQVTNVVRPDPTILARTNKNDILDVALVDDKVVILAPDGILGGLAFPAVLKLKSCIQEGYEYVAQVLRILDGLCEVEIRNK